MRLRQFVPGLFVLSMIAAVAGLQVVGPLPVVCLLAAYGAANITASVAVAVRKGIKLLPLLPVVFTTLHLSYGFGFLVGLWRFWNTWGKTSGAPAFAERNANAASISGMY
jgi:hypothetical protein